MATDTSHPKHSNCQRGGNTTMRLVPRVVMARPDDRNWPKDVAVMLWHCLDCEQVVGADDVRFAVPIRS